MFLSRNKNNNVYPCKPQFYYIKVEFKGSKLYRYVFVMGSTLNVNNLLPRVTEAEKKKDTYKAVPLLQFCFVRRWFPIDVCFFLVCTSSLLFVPPVIRDYGIS